MLSMVRHQLKRHRVKLAIGLPALLLVASSLTLLRAEDSVGLVPAPSRFVAVGEEVPILVVAETKSPINVVGAQVRFPSERIEIVRIEKTNSIVDLWTEEPTVASGTVTFSGGTIQEGGFVGSGVVATLHVRPLLKGKTTLVFDEAHMLAHDGTGTDIIASTNPVVLSVREAGTASPDVNNDNKVNLADFGIVSSRLFGDYSAEYDLNGDGAITLEDISIVVSSLFEESRLGSFALLSR